MSPHGQFLNFFIEKILLGWCGCWMLWIHGTWVQKISWSSSHGNSIGVLPLKVIWVFHTVGALRINWAGVICARVVWSRFFEAVSTSAKRNFLNNRTPISARFGHGVCGPVGILYVVHSVECLHVVRMVESHICTNCFRNHLECIHPLKKFSKNTSDGKVLLHG